MLKTTPTEVRGALVQQSIAQLKSDPSAAAFKATCAETACVVALFYFPAQTRKRK